MADQTPAQSSSRYRCSECGHGEHLRAWAEGVFEGPLGADGLLDAHTWAEDTMVFEGSIACDVHGDTVTIHKHDGKVWCVWTRCTRCEYGCTRDRWGSMTVTCGGCCGAGGSWQPVEEPAHV